MHLRWPSSTGLQLLVYAMSLCKDKQKVTEIGDERESDQVSFYLQTSRFWQRSDSEDEDEEAATTSEEESDDDSSSSDDEGQQQKKGPSRCGN